MDSVWCVFYYSEYEGKFLSSIHKTSDDAETAILKLGEQHQNMDDYGVEEWVVQGG
jgi:hypothetical protein